MALDNPVANSNSSCADSSLRSRVTKRPARIVREILRARWFIVYLTTVVGLIWFYEFRPVGQAWTGIQGTWRIVQGEIPDEKLGESYFQVAGSETWLVYPDSDGWGVQRSRIAVKPADGFFLVKRAFGFDSGNTRETEYIVFRRDDELYIIRGLAEFDPVKERTVEKLRSVESLPDDARESIKEYLRRADAESPGTTSNFEQN